MHNRSDSSGPHSGQGAGEQSSHGALSGGHQLDHPSRAAEAAAVRSAADLVNASSEEGFDAAVSNFENIFHTVQTEDPHFFSRLTHKVNQQFKPSSYGMASSEELLAGWS
ncbi:MAG: hypothetical protein U0103_24760 [Candidatus Obscuribacterales bacterium]